MPHTKQSFLKELEALKATNSRSSKFYSLFVSCVKEQPELVLQELIPEYESLLVTAQPMLRQAGFFSLLFKLKLQNPTYLEKALKTISNFNEDIDLRIWTLSSLGVAYESTKNTKILKILWVLYKKEILFEEEHSFWWLRKKLLQTLLEIWLPFQEIQAFQLQWYIHNDEETYQITIQHNEIIYKEQLFSIKKNLLQSEVQNLLSKIFALRELSTHRPLLAREKFELAILEKLQKAENVEQLETLQKEVENELTDLELKTQLLTIIAKKKTFFTDFTEINY
jgi:hypothetical protein